MLKVREGNEGRLLEQAGEKAVGEIIGTIGSRKIARTCRCELLQLTRNCDGLLSINESFAFNYDLKLYNGLTYVI